MAEDVKKRAFDFYISQGLAPHQAAAMVGHMMGESRGNPTIQETRADGTRGPGYGAFQWTTPSRRAGLDTFAKSGTGVELDPNALETQLLYSLRELDTTEKRAGDQLYGAKDYTQAVNAGMNYLRPQGHSWDRPEGGHNYAGRFNEGASLIGHEPMMGPAIASAGGDNTPVTGGLLQGIDADINAWGKMGQDPFSRAALDKVLAADKAKTDAMYGGIAKAGAGLAEAGMKAMADEPAQKPMQPMQASFHAPQTQELQGLPLPNFEQQLAQSRLALFPQKKKPWEFE